MIKHLLLLAITLVSFSNLNAQSDTTNLYFRHLRYNHVSPYIKIVGTYPIDKATASTTSHYVFKYNNNNELLEIVNKHYFTEKKHPLASIGAYKTLFTYDGDKEIRIFLDKNGHRISNDREVYKEVFSKDKKGNYTQLEFFDEKDKPMESNWGISRYEWSKKRKMIVEKRFNLKGEAESLSTYFEFGTTGMLFRRDGTPIGNYNLDENFEIVNNAIGVASYQDTYDENGNHVKYTYHDSNNKLVLSPYGFAAGIKVYDSIGNFIKQEYYDAQNKLLTWRTIPSNVHITLSEVATQIDSLEIKRISLGYLEALQALKPDLMNEVLNDSLNKITMGYNRDLEKEVAMATTKEQMIDFARDWNKSNMHFPPKPNNQVRILDIYNRIATVKLVSDNWVEYLHLIKLDGEWTIVNLLWQHKDVKRYP